MQGRLVMLRHYNCSSLSIGNNTQTLQCFDKYIGFKIFHQKKKKEITNYKKPVSSKYIRAI